MGSDISEERSYPEDYNLIFWNKVDLLFKTSAKYESEGCTFILQSQHAWPLTCLSQIWHGKVIKWNLYTPGLVYNYAEENKVASVQSTKHSLAVWSLPALLRSSKKHTVLPILMPVMEQALQKVTLYRVNAYVSILIKLQVCWTLQYGLLRCEVSVRFGEESLPLIPV
jgi:hypothetical protein